MSLTINQQRSELEGDFSRKIELFGIILTAATSGQEISARIEPFQCRAHRGLHPDGFPFPSKRRVTVEDQLLKFFALLAVEVVAHLLPELTIVDEAVQFPPGLLEIFGKLDVLADLVPRAIVKSSDLIFVLVIRVRRGGIRTRDALAFLSLVLKKDLNGVKVLSALIQGHEKEPLVFGRPAAPRSLLLLSVLTSGNLLTGFFDDASGLRDVIAEALGLFPLLFLLPQNPGTDSKTLATCPGQAGLIVRLIVQIGRAAVGLRVLGPVGRTPTFSRLALGLKPSLCRHRSNIPRTQKFIIGQSGKKSRWRATTWPRSTRFSLDPATIVSLNLHQNSVRTQPDAC